MFLSEMFEVNVHNDFGNCSASGSRDVTVRVEHGQENEAQIGNERV